METFLELMGAFAQKPEWSVRALAAHSGRAPSTVQGHMSAMRKAGLLVKQSSGRYRLNWRAYILGSGLVGGFALPFVAEPHLTELAEAAGETAHLAVLDEGETLYVAKAEGTGAVRVASEVGMRVPAYASASGKLLLALNNESSTNEHSTDDRSPGVLSALTPHTVTDPELLAAEFEKIRSCSYSLDNQEIELGMCCLAVPVMDYDGAVVAALSLSGPCERVNEGQRYLLYLARKTAARISKSLGYGKHVSREADDVHSVV